MMTFLAATSAAAEGEGIVFAFQNMVVGLGTVFLVLAFLILVISSFKYVNELTDVKEALQQVRAAKKGSATAPAAAQVPVKSAAPAAQPVPALPAGRRIGCRGRGSSWRPARTGPRRWYGGFPLYAR